jgi:hypothetical protein
MCDCWECNQTEEDNDLYIEWMYSNYCRTIDNPLSIIEWLKQYENTGGN